MSQSLFYWIIYSYDLKSQGLYYYQLLVSILILLDYLFLSCYLKSNSINIDLVSILILLDYLFLSDIMKTLRITSIKGLNPYFTGLSILIGSKTDDLYRLLSCLNPYFTGLSILILVMNLSSNLSWLSQSLFYWIIYSYFFSFLIEASMAPLSQSLFYWIIYSY